MLLNILYLVLWLVLAPLLLLRGRLRGRLRDKWLGLRETPRIPAPVAWFHGVSVGEVHLLRPLIAAFRRRFPHWNIVVSSTTDTGLAEARKHFADLSVIAFPFDFTWAVRHTLGCVQPELIVLAEGELWPNFLRESQRRRIPVVVINGRMSPRSAHRFRQFSWCTRGLFQRVDVFCAQTEEYAQAYRLLGAKEVVHTGNIKYDGVQTERDHPRTRQLRTLFDLRSDQLVWVAGSTQDPEERLAAEIFLRLRSTMPGLRLIVVPRHPERFDEVFALLEKTGAKVVRRSHMSAPDSSEIILVDTMGELSGIWGLADIAFVGGSLDGVRGGQNMIDPAAYGAAVLFGPHTWNFKHTVASLLANQAALQVADGEELEREVARLLQDAPTRHELGNAAREYVLSQQGATERTLDVFARWCAAAPVREAA